MNGFNAWDWLSICKLAHSKQHKNVHSCSPYNWKCSLSICFCSAALCHSCSDIKITKESGRHSSGGFCISLCFYAYMAIGAKSSGFWSASLIIFTECPVFASRHQSVLHVKCDLPHVLWLPSTDLCLSDFWLQSLKPHLKDSHYSNRINMQTEFVDFGMLWPRNIDRFSEDVVFHTLPWCIQCAMIWLTRYRTAEPL